MKRNRLKSPKRQLPKLPAVTLPQINWRGLASVAAVIAVGLVSLSFGREMVDLPVRKLDIHGRFQRVTELEIAAAAQPALNQSFLTLDLNEIRRRVTAIDWVDSVTLQRLWPDTLRISFEEHQAAASWGDKGLLNTRGELFAEDIRYEYRELPKLFGPDGSHRRVASRYLEVRDRVSKTNLTLDSIVMDERAAFTLQFAGGLSVRIGRDDVSSRIERFFNIAVPSLAGDMERVAYVDLRYPNGFAVGWREPVAVESTLARLD